jgi:hypothetical protein
MLLVCECGTSGRSRALMWSVILLVFGWFPSVIFSILITKWAIYCVWYEYLAEAKENGGGDYSTILGG